MPHPRHNQRQSHIDRQRHIDRTWGGCAGRYGTFCYVRDPGDLRSSEGDAMTRSPLTILFMPESAYGPTNNCIGIGNVLRQRGHRVTYRFTDGEMTAALGRLLADQSRHARLARAA